MPRIERDTEMSIFELRRELSRIHKQLRNRGLNPLEAVSQVSTDLSRDSRFLDDALNAGVSRGDLLAQLVQEFLVSEARNGLGQYLTPIQVARFLADVTRSRKKSPDVLDPFCGAGILLDAVAEVSPSARLQGIEINPTMARVASILGIVSGSEIFIDEDDAFRRFLDNEIEKVDIVVANPPFGSKITALDETDSRIPESLRKLGEIPAELFGLEVCVGSLKRNGKLAIVLPTSVLTNRTWSDFRTSIFSRIKVEATISLASQTFSPYKGVASACVILASNSGRTAGPWSIPHWDSYEIGYDDTGRDHGTNDLPCIAGRIKDLGQSDRVFELSREGAATFRRPDSERDGVALATIADVFVGKNPPITKYRESGPRILKVGDLAGSVLSWRDRDKGNVDSDWFNSYSDKHLMVGDICMTAAGHRPKYIGLKVDIIDSLPPEGAIASGEVMVVRVRPDSNVNPIALLLFLRSEGGYRQIQDLVRGSTGHLYARDLTTLIVPDLIQSEQLHKAALLYEEAIERYREFRALEDRATGQVQFT